VDDFNRIQRAKKRVEQIRGFYIHALVYLVVNLLIIGYFIFEAASEGRQWVNGETFELALFWGIGLGIHGFSVFGLNLLAGKNWEQRQIRKFMEEDRKEAEKFK
jgi:hypothetical protein